MVGPTNPSEEHFHRGLWGFDGNVWRKLQLLFGFGGVVDESLEDSNLDTGVNWLNGAIVPAGEIWVVQVASLLYSGTPPGDMGIVLVGLGGGVRVVWQDSPASERWLCWTGQVVLEEGCRMAGLVRGATAGDALLLRYAGYKMEIE